MNIRKYLSRIVAVLWMVMSFGAVQAQDIKVVYHVNTGVETASAILGNVRNHLSADPSAKITVVTHGPGIDFLLDGATNQMDQPFAGSVSELVSKGVEFRVCNLSLIHISEPTRH